MPPATMQPDFDLFVSYAHADYRRDLWVWYWRMADPAEQNSDQPDAESWWRRAYDVLAGMKRRGLFVSPEDEGFLRQIAAKLGLRGSEPDA